MDQFFYSNEVYNDKIILNENEALHALKVLRKNIGDKICVVDGLGNLFNATISSVDVNNCQLNVIDKIESYKKPNHYIHIGIAPPKSHDRLELFIEKVVILRICVV